MRISPGLILAVSAAATSTSTAAGAEYRRFDHYSVVPFVELQPGFTTTARQTFTLDLGGIGRAPIKVLDIAVNDRVIPKGAWETASTG